MSENGESIVTYDVPAITGRSLAEIVAEADKLVESVIKIKSIVFRVTNNSDWIDEKGKPYLQASGAQKVARVFGLSWTINEPVKEILESGHYMYTYTGEFSWRGASIQAIGTRNSKDGFFKQYSYEGERKTELPPSEIDPGDVKKAAWSNCIGNGVSSLLGIKNMTWTELEAAGLSKDKSGRVAYKEKGKQKEEIHSDEAKMVTTTVTGVTKKDGSTNGKPWTKYFVDTPEGKFITFSESLAKNGQSAKEGGLEVNIVYKESQFGKELETITALPKEIE